MLDDGSVWEVSSADQETASSWADGASITVTDKAGPSNTLVNTHDGSAVRARYVVDE